jgi:hypothetical protein
MKDVHSGLQPFRIAALRLIVLLDLFSKHRENVAGRIAGFEPVGERVLERIHLGPFFVRFQGIIENQSEVRRCRSRGSVRHNGRVRIEGEIVESWVKGKKKSDTPHKRAGTA